MITLKNTIIENDTKLLQLAMICEEAIQLMESIDGVENIYLSNGYSSIKLKSEIGVNSFLNFKRSAKSWCKDEKEIELQNGFKIYFSDPIEIEVIDENIEVSSVVATVDVVGEKAA